MLVNFEMDKHMEIDAFLIKRCKKPYLKKTRHTVKTAESP